MTSVEEVSPFQIRRFSDIAVDVIRNRILSGQVAPGGRLNEVALSEELRISRPPLREALRVLHGEGLVDITPGRGATVARIDLASVYQLGDVRIALEAATARLAAERATDDDVAHLTTVLADIESALASAGGAYPLDIDFHGALALATQNPRLAHSVEEVKGQLRLARAHSGNDPQRARQALLEHRAVCDAVVRRDPDAAEAAMRVHIEASMKAIVALIESDLRTDSEEKA